jgi:hypothetical protein
LRPERLAVRSRRHDRAHSHRQNNELGSSLHTSHRQDLEPHLPADADDRPRAPLEPGRPNDQLGTTQGSTRPGAAARPADAYQRRWIQPLRSITVSADAPADVSGTPTSEGQPLWLAAPWGAVLGCTRPSRSPCASIVFAQLSGVFRLPLGPRFKPSKYGSNLLPIDPPGQAHQPRAV